jgi:glutamate synthase (NADPH/NADH) large chain
MVELTPVENRIEQDFIQEYLHKHVSHTGSEVAKNILDNWDEYLPKFVKVMPLEYKRALEEMKLKALDTQLQDIIEEEQLGVQADG